MVRIIPWNLPPVKGGSVGGYTPEPTPPVPTNYPYDLDNIVTSVSFAVGRRIDAPGPRYNVFIKGILSVSGITILDTTTVASVIATVHLTPGTDTWTGASSQSTFVETDVNVDISGIMTLEGGNADIVNKNNTELSNFEAWSDKNYPTFVSTTATGTVTSIKVYNGNGVVIQEWSP